MRVLFQFVTVGSRKEARFDCKNNYKCNKLTNFWLDIIGKINCKTLVIIS